MSKPKDTICLSMSEFCELETITSVVFIFIIFFVFGNKYPTCIASLAKIRLFKRCQKKNNCDKKRNIFWNILCVEG
jgi:hypothetical protein